MIVIRVLFYVVTILLLFIALFIVIIGGLWVMNEMLKEWLAFDYVQYLKERYKKWQTMKNTSAKDICEKNGKN